MVEETTTKESTADEDTTSDGSVEETTTPLTTTSTENTDLGVIRVVENVETTPKQSDVVTDVAKQVVDAVEGQFLFLRFYNYP